MTPQKRTPAGGSQWAARHTFGNQITVETKLADSILAQHGASVMPVADGAIHRIDHPEGSRGNKALWYALHDDFAAHGDWRTGERHFVFADDDPDPETAREARERAEQARREREAERARQHALVADLCRSEWPTLPRANPSHPYLLRKRVESLGLRQKGPLLVVPLTDGERLVNWQTINHDGAKRFRPGGRVRGVYCPIGTIQPDSPLLICEGWATAMTLSMATGYATAAAMNAGNLKPVAESLRARYPRLKIVIAADNDHGTAGNPGITKGKEAAAAVGGRCIWPAFAEGDAGTDFNDAVLAGGEVDL